MLKLVAIGGAAVALLHYADLLPQGQAALVLSAAVGLVVLIWAGLFARV